MQNDILPKIKLRAIEPEDLDVLYKIENDRNLWNTGVTNVPYSRYALHEYIANSTNDIYTDKQVRLMIENGDGNVVGIADIVNFDPKHERAEIGIVIENTHRRCGYAYTALKHLIEYSVSVLHLYQLYAVVDADNKPSVELFNKAGFKVGAELKDWLLNGRNRKKALLMQLFL